MPNRRSKVDNGYLAASTNAHIGEALGADRQDLEDPPFSGARRRRGLLVRFRELWKRALAFLPKLGKQEKK